MASSYDEDEIPDAVLARLVPRKASRWVFATIASEMLEGMLEIAAEAAHEMSTVLHQHYNWHQDRVEMFESVGRDIETLGEVEGARGASTE